MSAEFHSVIRQLWSSLGLAEPEFSRTGSVEFAVDGAAMRLAPSEDGVSVMVEAKVDRLSANPVTLAEQVRRVLLANAAYISVDRACACLDYSADPPLVVIRALAPCDSNQLSKIARTINEVTDLVQVHERELGGSRRARAATSSRPVIDVASEDMLIFEP